MVLSLQTPWRTSIQECVSETLKTCHIPWGTHQPETMGDDTGNAYLEAYTHDKLFMIAGDEFLRLHPSLQQGTILSENKWKEVGRMVP